MKKLFILLLFFGIAVQSSAQLFTVQGSLNDSLRMNSIPFASVSLIDADSILVSTQRSLANGHFKFNVIDSGQYTLLIAHPKYAIHKRTLLVNKNMNLKQIELFQLKQLLKRVVITDKKAIVVKGDTVTFRADSFATKAGDVVEDLLKLLPGMEVDASGNITSQGKQVETVLVNGEEFFGNDPTVATQNLPSAAIEKVEVFDSKDAQEQFTGFTSESDTKVINLKLKKEMNKGAFGKIESAGGWEDRWRQKLMLNRFSDKEQIGGYYLSSSNGMANMDWQDRGSYGGSGSSNDGTSNQFRGGAQNGITKSWKTGVRYANKFEKNNQELNVNYGNLRTKRERASRSYTENLLQENTIYKSDTSASTNFNSSHAVNATYKTDIDSMLRLDYRLRFSIADRSEITDASSYNRNNEDGLISFNNRSSTTESINTVISNNITLNRKFKKDKRTLSVNLLHSYNGTNSDGFLLSNNALDLQNGGQTDYLDQKKNRNTSNRSINTKVVFTEPLSKKLRLKVSYNYSDIKNNNSNITSDTLGFGAGNFENQLDSLSNIFTSRSKSHVPGFQLRRETKKWKTTIGSEINFTSFDQFDLLRNNDFSYDQTNFIPRLSVQYKVSKYKKITISYNGRTSMPSPNQLQPFQDNTNPLSIVQGNPNLKMSYYQNLRLNYYTRSRIGGSYLSVWLNFGNKINGIGTHRIFESSGRTITTYENLPNAYNSNFGTSFSKKISQSKFRVGAYLWGNYAYSPNIIDNAAGYNQSVNVSISPSLRYYNQDLLSFNIDLATRYRNNSNNGNVNRTVSYISYSPSFDLNLYLPSFITIGNYIEYNYQPAVAPYTTPFTRTYMKSKISKQLLAKKNLTLSIELLDALNQNKGYNRQSNVNYNTESFYTTLGRYWLIGATWNFFSGPTAIKRRGAKNKDNSGKGWLGKTKEDKVEKKSVPSPDKKIIHLK